MVEKACACATPECRKGECRCESPCKKQARIVPWNLAAQVKHMMRLIGYFWFTAFLVAITGSSSHSDEITPRNWIRNIGTAECECVEATCTARIDVSIADDHLLKFEKINVDDAAFAAIAQHAMRMVAADCWAETHTSLKSHITIIGQSTHVISAVLSKPEWTISDINKE